jgi:osmotically-inducible protein OsmY
VKQMLALGVALLLLGTGLAGCSDKEGGTAQAPPNVKEAGGKAANTTAGTTGTGATGATSTAAADFTTDAGTQAAVQKALSENADVKDAAAKITVEVKDKMITLKGDVPDNDTKRKLGEATEAALKANNAPADIKVNNALMSQQH